MATITATALPVADSWNLSVGSGWITLMLIGMALCFLFMFGAMALMRGGRGWTMCGRWWPQEPERKDALTGTRVTGADPGLTPPESEA
jgi:hypothetical protein